MLAARNAPLRASSDPINGSAHPLNLPTFSHRSLAMLPLIPFFGNSEFLFRFSAPRALCKCDVTNSLRIAQRFHSFVLGYFFFRSKIYHSIVHFLFSFAHRPMIKNNQSSSFFKTPLSLSLHLWSPNQRSAGYTHP